MLRKYRLCPLHHWSHCPPRRRKLDWSLRPLTTYTTLKTKNRQIIEVVSGEQYISFLSLASQQWLAGRYPWFACLPHARTEQTAADRQPARWLKAPVQPVFADWQTLAASGYCLSLPCRIVPIEGKSLSGWIISNMPLNYDVKDNDNNFLSKW